MNATELFQISNKWNTSSDFVDSLLIAIKHDSAILTDIERSIVEFPVYFLLALDLVRKTIETTHLSCSQKPGCFVNFTKPRYKLVCLVLLNEI